MMYRTVPYLKIFFFTSCSFSMILWEIVNHKTPFYYTNSVKTKVLSGEHPQPEKTKGTPVEYQEIMEKGWNFSPKQRMSAKTMLEVLDKLESAEWAGQRIPRIGDVDDNSKPHSKTPSFSPVT